MVVLNQFLPADKNAVVSLTLALTAAQRTRSRYRFEAETGEIFHLRLPRGTVMRDRDLLANDTGEFIVQIIAKPEPTIKVIGKTSLDLLRAAYHLGNRHIPLEVNPTNLKLSPDPVLQAMLEQLGLEIIEEVSPFQPEIGAYVHNH
ncbi:MAG: urease accessory protein UreE [Microcoleaceae cyanobacterium MO_207.B10]|nr:urease accessory protein UreE [Microcoleaceae cyanobacterium MO_207.B10]